MLVAFALCCWYLFYALISYNYFTYVSIPNPRMLMIQARIFVTPYHICREIYESGVVNLSSYLLFISYHHPIHYGSRASWSLWHVWTARHTCIFYTGVSHVPYTCHCVQGQASKGLFLADVWSFHNVQNPSNSPPSLVYFRLEWPAGNRCNVALSLLMKWWNMEAVIIDKHIPSTFGRCLGSRATETPVKWRRRNRTFLNASLSSSRSRDPTPATDYRCW